MIRVYAKEIVETVLGFGAFVLFIMVPAYACIALKIL